MFTLEKKDSLIAYLLLKNWKKIGEIKEDEIWENEEFNKQITIKNELNTKDQFEIIQVLSELEKRDAWDITNDLMLNAEEIRKDREYKASRIKTIEIDKFEKKESVLRELKEIKSVVEKIENEVKTSTISNETYEKIHWLELMMSVSAYGSWIKELHCVDLTPKVIVHHYDEDEDDENSIIPEKQIDDAIWKYRRIGYDSCYIVDERNHFILTKNIPAMTLDKAKEIFDYYVDNKDNSVQAVLKINGVDVTLSADYDY
jgi:hypothetical protein